MDDKTLCKKFRRNERGNRGRWGGLRTRPICFAFRQCSPDDGGCKERKKHEIRRKKAATSCASNERAGAVA